MRRYLKNNSEITKIYQIIEYQPKKCFKNFNDKVTEFRIEGDKNPDKAIVGDTYKLLSNNSYGSVLMDKTKHTNIKYLTSKAKMTKIFDRIASGRCEVGRFKLEFEGTKMISLCSKSYIIENEEGKQKKSCKGVKEGSY